MSPGPVMRRLPTVVVGVLLISLWFSALPAWAGNAGPARGELFISALGAYYDLSDEYEFRDGEFGPGVAVGYAFHERWAAELSYFRFEGEVATPGGPETDDAEVDAFWANLLWLAPVETGWQPFVTVGAGVTRYDLGALGDQDETEINVGLGVFVEVSERVSFRGDARGVYLTDADDVVPFVSLGLTIALGRSAPVAPLDSDGDGVADLSDQCPETPPGRVVDVVGCEPDGDGDGVVDDRDACPRTPAGVAVDARGCALDGDGDGVPDYRDQCPDTDAGARVDERGCYIELEESVTIRLNIEFETDSAALRPEYRSEIDKVTRFLREYPTSYAVIEGHTDDTGAAAYNQQLSERRAMAVLDALIAGGVDPDRLSAIGYGEARPIEPNDTAQGRQRNRRVDAVMSGSRTVRQ